MSPSEPNVEIRPLGPGDAEDFQALRLRGLRESPEAFGSTYEEDAALPLDVVAARLIGEARAWPGVEYLTLTVVERARAARALYRSAGFRAFGRESDGLRQGSERDTVEYLTLTVTDDSSPPRPIRDRRE